MVYYQICRGGSELIPNVNEDWAWLRKSTPGVLTLKPAINTGTVSVTLNSTSITFSSGPTVDLDNYYFRVDGHADVFRIAAHTSGGTAATLDAVYTGTTNAAAGFTVFPLEYNLATDVMRIVAPMRTYVSTGGEWSRYKIYRSDLDSMEEEYPLVTSAVGVPDMYAEIGETTPGTRRVRFNRYIHPSQTTYLRVEYEYLFQPTLLTSPGTTEEPVLPKQWRHLLADFVLAYLFGVKDDSRSGAAAGVAQAGLMGLKNENRYQTATATRNYFRLKPRMVGWQRGLLRTESGIILG
jgi:hypothetical protein